VLARVIDLSLRHRGVVLVACALLAVLGAVAFTRLPLDAFPDTTPVQVTVHAAAPALAAEEVERQLVAPIEQALGGLPGLEHVRSISRFGFGQVIVVFVDGTDLLAARQRVGERLAALDWPDGFERPTLGPIATGLGEVFHYIVRGEGKPLVEVRAAHDGIIRPRLLAVPGVAEVVAWGGEEKQLQVVVDPERLVALDVTLRDVVEATTRSSGTVGGGVISSAGESMVVQGLGLARSPADLEDVVIVERERQSVRVRDVGRVIVGADIRHGAVTAEGRGEVVLGLGFVLLGENSRDVTRRLAARLDDAARALPDGIRVEPVYVRTDLVDTVLRTVRTNLFEGALLVVAVLFVFLGNVRAGLIVALAIPLSLLFAFDLMLRFGIAGSLMSLGAIDFGLVVDSSVVMVENSVRRLAEEGGSRAARDVVRDAALEVRRPTLFGELIIAVVYLPVLTLEGIEGKLFRPMALTVVFVLLGSMLLSLTVLPALASLVLRTGGGHGDNAVVRALKAGYRPVLAFSLRHRRPVLLGAVAMVAGAALLARQLGSEFVPRLREMSLVINTVRLASVSLDESVRYGTRIEALLLERFPDEILHVWTRTGAAEIATDPMGIELADVFITLAPRESWTRADTQDALVEAMRTELETLPGMRMVFTQPIEMRVNEMIAGIRSDVGVKLFGDDLEVLRSKAQEVRALVAGVEGAADVTVEQLTGLPVLQVVVDREACARHGVAVGDVLELVQSVGRIQVGEVREGVLRVPIVVRLDERFAADPASLGTVPVTSRGGGRVPLRQVASLEVVEGPAAVSREWGQRRVVVQANARGRDVGSFVADVQAALRDRLVLPTGYHVELGGQFEHLERAQRRLLVVVPLALVLVLGLLHATYGRILDALRVFTGVPFAAVGGIVALWLRDLPFSISAAVGFVALSGVSVLGDMVLVSTVRQLREQGVALREALERAAETRLRPVLMTSLVAALGFVPMALNTGVGAEVQRPLATVVIGGVLSSMLLTLVVLPVLYVTVSDRTGPSARQAG
jgi:cobalt-zinc-cadmium resistance protein CzcA